MPTEKIDLAKKQLRKVMVDIRKIVPRKDRQEESFRIAQRLMQHDGWENARVVCMYISLPEEVDTKPLLADLWQRSRTVVIPRTGKDGLTLHKISSIHDLSLGPYGILEPNQSC